VEPVDAGGPTTRPEPLERREATVRALLDDTGPNRVVALDRTGFFQPMPADVPITPDRLIPRITANATFLDHTAEADSRTVVNAWADVRTTGLGRCRVHPRADPEAVVELVFVDMTHRYGVFLGFMIGAHRELLPQHQATVDIMRPRVCFVRKNEVARIVEVDEAFTAILGWAPEDVTGQSTLEILHPDDHNRAIANWMDMVAAPGNVRRTRLRHRHVDGRWVWFEVTNTNLLTESGTGHVTTEMVDISEETAATEALRAGELLLRRLTDSLPEGVVQIAPDGVAIYRNTRLAAILEREIHASDDIVAAVRESAAVAGAVEGALRRGLDSQVEAVLDEPGDRPRRLHLTITALVQPDGSIDGAVICVEDVTEAARLRDVLAHRADHDALTDCLSRGALMSRLTEELARPGDGVGLLFVDVDKFKQINDEFGHAAGDDVLRHVAAVLTASLREGDVVGRIGGDEFVMVLPGAGSADDTRAAADRVSLELSRPFDLLGRAHVVTASVGSAWTGTSIDADSLMAMADVSMYRRKHRSEG
jgi:diguanylate cyclase (GGDEF)-like protein/PAS domain S-box-containing protein